ncbi:hypothetical protein ACTHQ4_10345 [Alkalicoccobacillus gibsonii]|uniref:hypothetical protein n=1 Tax=Alkalicoccobacillus gibsonii TaxID=79881 RepID=UPI003F7CC645
MKDQKELAYLEGYRLALKHVKHLFTQENMSREAIKNAVVLLLMENEDAQRSN